MPLLTPEHYDNLRAHDLATGVRAIAAFARNAGMEGQIAITRGGLATLDGKLVPRAELFAARMAVAEGRCDPVRLQGTKAPSHMLSLDDALRLMPDDAAPTPEASVDFRIHEPDGRRDRLALTQITAKFTLGMEVFLTDAEYKRFGDADDDALLELVRIQNLMGDQEKSIEQIQDRIEQQYIFLHEYDLVTNFDAGVGCWCIGERDGAKLSLLWTMQTFALVGFGRPVDPNNVELRRATLAVSQLTDADEDAWPLEYNWQPEECEGGLSWGCARATRARIYRRRWIRSALSSRRS